MNPTIFALSISSGSLSVTSIFQSVWKLFMGFFGGILGDAESLLSTITSGLGQGIQLMFFGWGQAFAIYGILGPVAAVASLAIAGFVAYAMIDLYGVEHDILRGEEDL